MDAIKEYIVTTGILEGHIFMGHPVTINGEQRIWDDDSNGNSYPVVNCLSADQALPLSEMRKIPSPDFGSRRPFNLPLNITKEMGVGFTGTIEEKP